jgi:hypothetical protein
MKKILIFAVGATLLALSACNPNRPNENAGTMGNTSGAYSNNPQAQATPEATGQSSAGTADQSMGSSGMSGSTGSSTGSSTQ